MGVSRSTYYYSLKHHPKSFMHIGGRPRPGWSFASSGTRISDAEIKNYLKAIIEMDGFYYGYRKLTYALRRMFDLVINKKKVYRLCKEMDALIPQRKVKAKYPKKLARNTYVTGPNQLWETDVKFGYVEGEDRFFQIASIIDVFDRVVVGTHAGLTCVGRDLVRVLRLALESRGISGKGLTLRSDNGPQFKSYLLRKTCNSLSVVQEFIPGNTPNLNAHIESYNSILERECLSGQVFRSYAHALRAIHNFVEFYNTRRIHSSCGYRPPMEYYQAIQNNSAKAVAMKA